MRALLCGTVVPWYLPPELRYRIVFDFFVITIWNNLIILERREVTFGHLLSAESCHKSYLPLDEEKDCGRKEQAGYVFDYYIFHGLPMFDTHTWLAPIGYHKVVRLKYILLT